MNCPRQLSPLACGQSGVGFLAQPWQGGDGRLVLMAGQGASFPVPTAGTRYWVDVSGCTCCLRLEVIGRENDELILADAPDTGCNCARANARVAYATNSIEHVRLVVAEMGINIVKPLHYDCATRTLSIDCEELKAMVFSPCGGGG